MTRAECRRRFRRCAGVRPGRGRKCRDARPRLRSRPIPAMQCPVCVPPRDEVSRRRHLPRSSRADAGAALKFCRWRTRAGLPAASICEGTRAQPRHVAPRAPDRRYGFREPGEFSNRERTNRNNSGTPPPSATEWSVRFVVVQAGRELALDALLSSPVESDSAWRKKFRPVDI